MCDRCIAASGKILLLALSSAIAACTEEQVVTKATLTNMHGSIDAMMNGASLDSATDAVMKLHNDIPTVELIRMGKGANFMGHILDTLGQVVFPTLHLRAANGDADAKQFLDTHTDQEGPSIEVHVIDLSSILGGRQANTGTGASGAVGPH
jgi:hypothetical protein